MTRPLRIEYPDAYYHVTCRGNEKREIFKDDWDRSAFLERLQRSLEIYSVQLHCYVLMNNHFHLIVKTPKANLSEFMRHLNVSYSSVFNRHHTRVGHLYQGRFKAILVEADSYLLELSRYVHLNPVRVRSMGGGGHEQHQRYLNRYRWSSLEGYLPYRKRRSWVVYDEVLAYVGGLRKRYAEFVADGLRRGYDTPWGDLKGQVVLGEESFWERVKGRWIKEGADRREQPSLRWIKGIEPRKVLKEVAGYFQVRAEELSKKRGRLRDQRALGMELMYRHSEVNLREIGQWMGGMDYAAVSRERGRLRDQMERDPKLRRWMKEIEERLT